tara:strand:+ start:2254 stop:3012 length:759 start_codon:yes stop_codon:yes gene_type:complete
MSLLLGTAKNTFTLAPATGEEFIIELDAQYGSSTTWTDNSGSGLNATITGTTVGGSGDTKYVDVDGQDSDYAQVDVGTAFDSLSAFTIEAVFRTDEVMHAYPRFNFNQSSEYGFRLVTTQSTTGWNFWKFEFNGTGYSLDDKTASSSNSAYSYTSNTKIYCAATYDGTTLKSYFGKDSSVTNVTTTTVAESDRGVMDASYKSDKTLAFGRETNYSPTRYQDSRFYYWSLKDKALTATEISDRFSTFDSRFSL